MRLCCFSSIKVLEEKQNSTLSPSHASPTPQESSPSYIQRIPTDIKCMLLPRCLECPCVDQHIVSVTLLPRAVLTFSFIDNR